jgi:hypothetical protein
MVMVRQMSLTESGFAEKVISGENGGQAKMRNGF